MELNTEALKFILGMKIRQTRHQNNLSLKQLSESSGLSLSYISEIEKGKKYPKPEMLFKLAKGLNSSYEELVSLKFENDGNPITAILNSPFLNELPLKEFGISMTEIFELANNTPTKASAFIQTLLEIGRNYDLQVEHFLLASLRSYQKMHLNYFPDLEQLAAHFLKKTLKTGSLSASFLEQLLLNDYDVLVTYQDLSKDKELQSLRSIWIQGKHQKVIINQKLNASQRIFELAKEVFYRIKNIKVRPESSTWMKIESFEQVYNNFEASYFAGALILPEQNLVKHIAEFFRTTQWQPEYLIKIIDSYPTTPEMFLYRLSQLIPHHFQLPEMHYMRLHNSPGHDKFYLTKELNTTDVFVPRGIGPHEHHCRRWASIQLLKKLAKKQKKGKNPKMLISAQRSKFDENSGVFFNIAIARPMSINDKNNSGMTLGFKINKRFKNKTRFWNDHKVSEVQVHETCERCPLTDKQCKHRSAKPDILNKQLSIINKESKLQEFIQQQRQ
ncbi:MAG: helix-turn-helix domain-containing protein [Marinicellaceae bacterium]